MTTLMGIILLIAIAAFFADRVGFLKDHQFRIGILFGILAVIANTFSADVYEMGISVGLIDAPPMIAGLLFGPQAGIVAGVIAAVERAMTPLWGVGKTTWIVCSFATLMVSFYAVAFQNFVFDHHRPSFWAGAITVAFGEVLHLAFFFLSGLNDLSLTCEVIYASAEPMILGSVSAMALSHLACWHRTQKHPTGNLNTPTRSLLVFGISFLLIVRIAVAGAGARVDNVLQLATERFDAKMSTIIELFMYRCAQHIMNNIDDPLNCTQENLVRGAREHGLDEANIISADEKIIASNLDRLVNQPFPRTGKVTGEFFSLIDDNTPVVAQGFRRDEVIKEDPQLKRYLGIPFPKKNAFLEVGYSFDRLERELKHFFLPSIADTPVYYTGYFLVVDPHGVIVNDVRGHHNLKNKHITQIGFSPGDLNKAEKTMFFARLVGDWSRCMVERRVGTHKVIAVLPLKDVFAPTLRLVFICGIALFCVCLLFRWTLVKAARNQRMLDEMHEKNKEQKEREMALARSVQTSEFKVDNPDTDVYHIAATAIPAREVGGDTYDYFELPDGKVAFGIADIAGKGISAAIFMMKTRTSFRLIGTQGKGIRDIMEGANKVLCRNNDAMMFATSWGGIYDPATQELEYVCAGHNPPFIVSATGEVRKLDCLRMVPLGIRPGYRYTVQKTRIEHGDCILIYTDGVTEAMNSAHQLYGETRLVELLKNSKKDPQHSLIEQVQRSVENFVGETEQSDDITMLSMLIK